MLQPQVRNKNHFQLYHIPSPWMPPPTCHHTTVFAHTILWAVLGQESPESTLLLSKFLSNSLQEASLYHSVCKKHPPSPSSLGILEHTVVPMLVMVHFVTWKDTFEVSFFIWSSHDFWKAEVCPLLWGPVSQNTSPIGSKIRHIIMCKCIEHF